MTFLHCLIAIVYCRKTKYYISFFPKYFLIGLLWSGVGHEKAFIPRAAWWGSKPSLRAPEDRSPLHSPLHSAPESRSPLHSAPEDTSPLYLHFLLYLMLISSVPWPHTVLGSWTWALLSGVTHALILYPFWQSMPNFNTFFSFCFSGIHLVSENHLEKNSARVNILYWGMYPPAFFFFFSGFLIA